MKRKICFISLGSYPLFSSNQNLKYVGGAEVKQVLISKELAKRGYNISFITYDEEGEKKAVFKEINIIKSFSPSNNYNLFYKARLLWKSLKKANSEIFIQSGGVAGFVGLFCYIKKKKFIRWIASDKNVLLNRVGEKTPLFLKILLYVDIKLSSMIIVQNKFQKQLIENKFKKRNIIIKNPIYIPRDIFDNGEKKKGDYVLWVGSIRTIKQPELYLRIARMLPEYKFIMIGGKSDTEPDLYDPIREEAQALHNLEFLGFISYDKMQKYYEESLVLLNTSKAEGFPNTFLEAWVNNTPVISLNVDPDEVICNEKLGLHSKTFEQMIIDVNTFLRDDKLRDEMGANGRKYVEENHDIKKIADQFVDILTSFKI
ncbi:Glycosyl transferases group 1 [uncultured archaeon]|nr:Glycosyl transferases group 1 [uncultured archaeon]